jgi:hypothetical protein
VAPTTKEPSGISDLMTVKRFANGHKKNERKPIKFTSYYFALILAHLKLVSRDSIAIYCERKLNSRCGKPFSLVNNKLDRSHYLAVKLITP